MSSYADLKDMLAAQFTANAMNDLHTLGLD